MANFNLTKRTVTELAVGASLVVAVALDGVAMVTNHPINSAMLTITSTLVGGALGFLNIPSSSSSSSSSTQPTTSTVTRVTPTTGS